MITLSVSLPAIDGAKLIAPIGMSTPHASVTKLDVQGATASLAADPGSAQHILVMSPTEDEIRLTYRVHSGGAPYPEAMFTCRDSRYTRSAAEMAEEAAKIGDAAGGGTAAVTALANHVAQLFQYGHPEHRYYEDHNEIPQLCGLTEGSCVDINAYFIACCRAAGLQAGYVTGYFVPQEKRDWCEDAHCWVVTRTDGEILEWDIAHHLKLGRKPIAPGLNPKPGVRVPMAHSMGLNFPEFGVTDAKLISEPMWLMNNGSWQAGHNRIRLEGYEELVGADDTRLAPEPA